MADWFRACARVGVAFLREKRTRFAQTPFFPAESHTHPAVIKLVAALNKKPGFTFVVFVFVFVFVL
ncbi:hypothetical protein [Marinobacter sp.]|uniref:hypothetical protein n=1 Tax=Marinobacter sp. TaxID=50741 RepID=UPI00356ACE01